MQRVVLGVLLAAAVLVAWQVTRPSARARAGTSSTTRFADPRAVPQDVRAQGLHFDAGVTATDRAAVLTAVADARPEAQVLIRLVDGLVDVHIGTLGTRIVGQTETRRDGYVVTLDLAMAGDRYGRRGIDRLVLHELGHVVDHALLTDALRRQLDAGIPRGWGCEDGGTSGACAAREERFAESFAKWATGDIGVDVQLGYRVPPPSSMRSWGIPLGALARAAG